MHAFTYHRPTTLDDALKLLADDGDSKLLAGGQTLIPTMKQRLAAPSDVIDIGRLAELKGVAREDAKLIIGAGMTHAEVAASDVVRQAIPALAHLAEEIGDPHVRHMGTLGGAIANNDPTADYPAACVGLGATIETSQGKFAADKFFTGLFETALGEKAIITKVVFPIPERAAYVKFPSPASRYAMVGVFVAKFAGSVRVAVTGAGPCVFRVAAMEQALANAFSADKIAGIKVSAQGLNSDLHASADYRAHLIAVMAKRAVAAAR